VTDNIDDLAPIPLDDKYDSLLDWIADHPRSGFAEIKRATGIEHWTLRNDLQTLTARKVIKTEGRPFLYSLASDRQPTTANEF